MRMCAVARRSRFGADARRDGLSGGSGKQDAHAPIPTSKGDLRPQDPRCDRKKLLATARGVLAKSLKNNDIDRTDRTERKKRGLVLIRSKRGRSPCA